MSEYVFLYRGGERPASAEDVQKIMQKWVNWFKDMSAKGQVVNRGEPLEAQGKIVKNGKTVTDAPFAEAKDVIGGFSLISAKDLNEAAEIAKGCPILERGGQVEVRPVMQLDM